MITIEKLVNRMTEETISQTVAVLTYSLAQTILILHEENKSRLIFGESLNRDALPLGSWRQWRFEHVRNNR